jgi:hypothetical protein
MPECTSQDVAGELSRILRAVPCRESVFSDCLPTQTIVPISPAASWMETVEGPGLRSGERKLAARNNERERD